MFVVPSYILFTVAGKLNFGEQANVSNQVNMLYITFTVKHKDS